MTLLNPIWLWALGGLAIPIAIHLLSRKEGKTIRIGSIRFLTETSTSKFSSIRLNEVVLLILRSLLIILIVLFLAGLLLSTANNNASTKWAVIEKGVENNDQFKNLLDSLQKNNYEIRILAKDFPLPKDDTITQAPDYYKLSEQLSQKGNLQAVVVSSNSLSNFKGKRISLPKNIIWLSFPISSNLDLTVDSPNPIKDTLYVTVAYDKGFQYDKKIILASLHALQSTASSKLVITENEIDKFKSSGRTDWVIWLSNSKTSYPNRLLRFQEYSSEELIIHQTRNDWILTQRLNEEIALEQHLSIQLMDMLFNKTVQQELIKLDKRTVSDDLVWSSANNTIATEKVEAGHLIDKVLILLIAVTFITERILAFYRKQ